MDVDESLIYVVEEQEQVEAEAMGELQKMDD